MSAPFILMLGLFLLLGGMGVPVSFAMFSASIVYLFLAGQDMGLVAEQSLNGLFDGFVLLAVPLFILAANFMNAGTVSDRLLAFCLALVGRFRGGLAQVNVVASMIFAGMSGSAIADAAGIGKVITEMMIRRNAYPRGYAAAITAASATIGPIIPPSIPMVLYAMVSDTSIGFLFLGGIL
ncbi:MAG: TRAP transporter large permease subunit, partial [Deltaproteobacteria bacterium]|nr:TRAP transporter large permease subunit [Deltaproteobacteria bacterium]